MRIFPLKRNSKTPAVDAFYDVATTDATKIRSWLEDGKNLAISTDRLLVVDIDHKEGAIGEENLLALIAAHSPLPPTITARTTSGGRHLYFRLPEDCPPVPNSQGKLARCVDVRGHHGYVVAPPSAIDGKPYSWAPNLGPDDTELAPAPQWLIDLAGEAIPRERSGEAPLVEPDTIEAEEEATWYLAAIPPASILHGARHHDAYVRACMLRSFGISEDAAVRLMCELWAPKCVPPATAEETDKETRSAYRYAKGRFGDAHPDIVAARQAERDRALSATPDDEFEADPTAKPKPKRKYLTAYDEFITRPEPTWLVKGFIQDNGVGLIAGKWGARKSFLVYDLLLHLAYGFPSWHGEPLPRGPHDVLLVAPGGEGMSLFRYCVDAFKIKHGLSENPSRLVIMDEAMTFMDDKALKELLAEIRATGKRFTLSAVDTMGRAASGAVLNDSDVVTKLMDRCGALGNATGGAVIGVHHENKAGDVLGSVYFLNNADFVHIVSKDEGETEEGGPPLPGEWLCLKMKGAEDGWRRRLTFERLEWANTRGEPVSSLVVGGLERGSAGSHVDASAEFEVSLTPAEQQLFDALEDLVEAEAEEREADKYAIGIDWETWWTHAQSGWVSRARGHQKGGGVRRNDRNVTREISRPRLVKIRNDLAEKNVARKGEHNQWFIVERNACNDT
jgi:hypothetical protein